VVPNEKGAMAGEFIGRRDESLALEAFLGAIPGGGQALLLEGDAGIGKSALWNEGLRLARERSILVLKARGAPSETQIAFAIVGDLFAPVLDATLPRLGPVQRRALEIAFLLRTSDGEPADTRLLGLALLSVVRAVAQDGPLLLALDDVQWVDPSSAEVLRFVLRRLEGEPVGVLATVRERPVEAPLELDRAFAEFRRLTVGPLSVGAIHRLVWGRLAVNLPRPLLLRVHEISGGNPFFALEMGRGLLDGTVRADGTEVALPESLVAVVTERLRALPTRVRETLVAVAALAAPSVVLLEAMGPAVVDDIELAQKRGVLELDGDRIRFTHPLLAPVCYTAITLHRRRRLHRRLAGLEVDPEERARHLAIAATGPDEETAAVLEKVASQARARGAAQAAADLAERAVVLTPPASTDIMNRRRMLAAEHSFHAGDVGKAIALLEQTVDSATPGPLRAEVLSRLADVSAVTEGCGPAEALYTRALAEPDLDARQRVEILGELAFHTAARGDTRSGVRYVEEGLALAEQLGDPVVLSHSRIAVAIATFFRTACIRRDLLEPAIDIGRGTGDEPPVGDGPRQALAFQLGRTDRRDEARAMWRALIAEAAEREDPEVGWRLFQLAQVEANAGAWDEAIRLCDEAMEVAHQTGEKGLEPFLATIRAEVEAHRGDVVSARVQIADLLPVLERLGRFLLVHRLKRALALADLCSADAASSWREVEPLFAGVDELGESVALLAGSVAIEALIGCGDLQTAVRLQALLDERAAGADTPLLPLARRCRGLLLAERGDMDAAIAALEAAAVEPEPPLEGNPFELGRTLLALGTVQRRAQHKRAARESLQRAAEIFERLGARLWLAKARSELRRIGGRTASTGQLSETEQRIVDLVVAGRKNREVAAELSLSPNTVAWNLSKVYRKLGVSSRTELAAHLTTAAHG
jgi:DNA-binding CsgD family transcriptional regulator